MVGNLKIKKTMKWEFVTVEVRHYRGVSKLNYAGTKKERKTVFFLILEPKEEQWNI